MSHLNRPNQPPHARRIALAALAVVALLLVGGYLTVGYVAADRLTVPRRDFSPDVAPRSPAAANTEVRVPARGDNVPIAGTYVPAAGATRAVIMVHGKDNNRKQEWDGRWPELADSMQRAGFAVLLIDLRGHGQSGDGRFTFGLIERRDVLGAYDWLRAQGFQPGRIGALGLSLGGASSVGAAADEPGIGALVLDSTFAEFPWVLEVNWAKESGLPDFFMSSALLMSRPILGVNLGDAKPDAEIGRIAPRPLLLIYSQSDTAVLPRNFAALRAAAPGADVWEVTGPSHARTYNAYPAEYTRHVIAHFERMPK